MLPDTTSRVEQNTAENVNERIWRKTECNIQLYSKAGPEAIDMRLQELDREWDIERTIEANAATFSLLGLGLGAFVNKRFYLLSAGVAGFLLQHALQGWCPPVPLFRRMGVRTMHEINHERSMLKAARGDYQTTQSPQPAAAVLETSPSQAVA
ncbi:hypothetical protein [Desulfocurvibacter africanus]|uniref:hypothetical protein n=1 Tax=Desulfocurvibacter africanus TaxID=873 RepID=UPI00041DC547|nr:hypothetical protein [Desulfocurvibacter africanus]